MTANGLSWESAVAAIERFSAQHREAPLRVVLTTFDFDADTFQQHWMRVFRRHHAQVLVLADVGSLRRRPPSSESLVGFQLSPVAVRGAVFHAKVALLRAGEASLAILGSGNLTAGGVGDNLELQLTDCTEGRQRSPIVAGVAAFLDAMTRAPAVRLQPSAIRFMRGITSDLPRSSDTVNSSLDGPLSEMFSRHVLWRIPLVQIVSPWHAGTGAGPGMEPAVLRMFRNRYGSHIRVLTDGDAGKAPSLPGCQVCIYQPGTDKDDAVRPSRLHAKAYVFQRRDRDCGWLFIGSANATTTALQRRVGAGGNVEVLAALPLTKRAAVRLDADLMSMFKEARQKERIPTPRPDAYPSGVILGGEIVPQRTGTILRLCAISRHVRSAVLLPDPSDKKRKAVRVQFRNGIASVSGADLSRLIPNVPDRRDGVASVLIYERHRNANIPVVVSLLLQLGPGDNVAAIDLLTDMMRWVTRRWPVRAPSNKITQDDNTDDAGVDMDGELDDLTRSDHLGELDRLGIAVARLTQHMHGCAGAQLNTLLDEFCRETSDPHLVAVIRDAFRRSRT